MRTVYQATPYRYGAMGSLGDATYMLLRQHCFPHKYDETRDVITGWDSDRILQQFYNHFDQCSKKHFGDGRQYGFEQFIQSAEPEKVIAWIADMLSICMSEQEKHLAWTGFRVMGTVNRSNGYPVYTLQLFWKHPETATPTFSTQNAPNVQGYERAGRRVFADASIAIGKRKARP